MNGSYYSGYGVEFWVPDEWTLSEDRQEARVSINVQSPDTSFWSLTLFYDRPDPQQVAEAVLEGFRQVYDNLDVYRTDRKVGPLHVVGRDIEFFCWDLLNSAFLRVFQTERFTVLVLFQGTDSELPETRPVMDRISKSLRFSPSLEQFEGL